MRIDALSSTILIASFLAAQGTAIFADEAYEIDYHFPLLGFPQAHSTFFHRPSANSKATLIYTLSEKHVLGAVNPKDGALLWRQRLLETGHNLTTPGLLKARKGADSIISSVEDTVQAWNAVDGRLVWEFKEQGTVKDLELLKGNDFGNDVLVAYVVDGLKTRVMRLAANSGAIMWLHEDVSGNTPVALFSSKDTIYYVSLHAGLMGSYKIHISQLDESPSGKIAAHTIQVTDAEVASPESVIFAGDNAGTPLLAWTDKAKKTLRLSFVGSKQVTTVNVSPQGGETVDKIVVHAAESSAAHSHFLVQYQSAHFNWAEVYHLKNLLATKIYDLPRVDGRGAFSLDSMGSDVYFIRHSSSDTTLYASTDATILAQWNVEDAVLSNVKDPFHAISEVVMRAGAKYSLRSALTLATGDWELVRNGDRLWSRPEGLAGIVAARFIDSPHGNELLEDIAVERHGTLLGAYIHRVRRHLRELQYLPRWFQGLPLRILPNFAWLTGDSQDNGSLHEAFEFNKIVLVATANGRLAAFDTRNRGSALWVIKAVNIPAGEEWGVLGIDQEADSVVVRGMDGEFLRVRTGTGEIVAHQPGGMITPLKTSVQVLGNIESIPINRNGSLGEISNPRSLVRDVVVTESEDSIIRGWRIAKSGSKSLAWQFAPSDGQKIHSVKTRPVHDPVASIGKALGDRNVLYKYINPNIFLLTTVGTQDSTASFHIVDSSSGSVIYSAEYSGVDTNQPISSTLTENWFAYSFFSQSTAVFEGSAQLDQKSIKGYQLIVSELFESPFPNDRGPFRDSANFSSTHPLPANEAEFTDHPHVISQTFLIPGPISYMTTTSTLQGITPRSLLCVLPRTNAIISIPRHVLDPRRPVGRDPTPVEAEEGLFRYGPILDFEPKWLLNHKRDLLSVSTVLTTPSRFESTSLIFAYGEVDIFGTRVSPIGSFDMLGKGFSKSQLLSTVAALAIGTALLAPFVRRKQIDGQWRA